MLRSSRNITVYALSQALMMSAMTLILTTTALTGYALAEDKSMATIPVAAIFIAMLLTSIPASIIMGRIGRKAGFMFATLFGVSGSIIMTWSIIEGVFWSFTLGSALIGIYNGFGNYYRFAAAEMVEYDKRSRAISYVMAGGVIAAIVGPNLANYSKDWILSAPFAGSYAALIVIYSLSFMLLGLIDSGTQSNTAGTSVQGESRPLLTIVRQPRFILALVSGMLGYGIMTFVMTATPLSMQSHAHDFGDTSFIIQWHALGMFAPSFVTGYLISRYGVYRILYAGAFLGIACVAINLTGTSLNHFWVALFALGVSWNFLFIGATSLLTETYGPQEQVKTQAFNDFFVFSTVAVASLSAGALQYHLGWQVVNMGVIPLLVIILVTITWVASVESNRRTDASSAELQTESE